MMVIICLGIFFPVLSVFAGTSTWYLSPQEKVNKGKTSVSFMGYIYTFEYGDEIQNEYFIEGESIDGFSSLIAVHLFKNRTDSIFVAQGLYDKLLADNQVAKMAIHRFTKEPTITFFLKTEQGLELNLWRFYRNPDRAEVIGMQYLKTFKNPQSPLEKERLKNVVQVLLEQFLILPKLPFVR
ncbi:MAG: hypothetical protein IKV03_04880 [Alphaproteobacteria bacterium]|nr:hypothetical protein [Alphaproteobacteria bacterium]